jgi:hypothetical protein
MNTTKPRIKIKVFETTRNYGLMVLRADGVTWRRSLVTDTDIAKHGSLEDTELYFRIMDFHALADAVLNAQH